MHSESSQTSKMKFFAKTVNGWKSVTIFAKSSILDVLVGSGYSSASGSIIWSSPIFWCIKNLKALSEPDP